MQQSIFDDYLDKFKAIILTEDCHKSLKSLSTKVENDMSLNSRQRDVIMARCRNFISGNWQKSAR